MNINALDVLETRYQRQPMTDAAGSTIDPITLEPIRHALVMIADRYLCGFTLS